MRHSDVFYRDNEEIMPIIILSAMLQIHNFISTNYFVFCRLYSDTMCVCVLNNNNTNGDDDVTDGGLPQQRPGLTSLLLCVVKVRSNVNKEASESRFLWIKPEQVL